MKTGLGRWSLEGNGGIRFLRPGNRKPAFDRLYGKDADHFWLTVAFRGC